MDHSISAPLLLVEGEAKRGKKYNIKQYKGLLGSVADIKSSIEDERRRAQDKVEALESRMKEGEAEASVIQKELSIQLRCAGRSYQQLLGATRELSEQLRAEEDRRVTEIEALEKQIKELRSQLAQAAKPWKEEVAKRDLKILKLQEAAADQETRLRKAEAAIPPIQQKAEEEIKVREEKLDGMLREIAIVHAECEQQLLEKDALLEAEVERAKKEKAELLLRIRLTEERASMLTLPYEKQIKELEVKVQGLEQQLAKVDYKPLETMLKQREVGYAKLVKDFRVKQQLNQENLERMRAGFELTIERMDKVIQQHESEHRKRLAPWQDLVARKENEVTRLNAKLDEFRKEEQATRKAEKEVLDEIRRELRAAKEAEEKSRQEAYKLRRKVEGLEETFEGDSGPGRKVAMLQIKLDEVTKQCEATVRSKDRELKQKNDIISALQKRVLEEACEREHQDKEWDHRVQQKEEGYGLVCANLAFAEGQIVEERGRTAAALATVRKRERSIERLKAEHVSELEVRLSDHEALEQRIRELEAELDEVGARLDQEKMNTQREWEERYNHMRRRYDDQVKDLRVEMVWRDRQRALVDKELLELRSQFERARGEWEEKERELEIAIRSRDRQIVGLKNEIEFVTDSWEIKYNRLMGLYETLQKKYDEINGPSGPAEAYRRIRDLKVENMELLKETMELKELIKKQKRQIRDLQLDYDLLIKETADLIAEKERGMAEMVGDMAKLQAKLRAEVELKERLVKEMTVEKYAIVASFEGRIRELEQQVEAMRFTDRQELLDKMDIWKRAYERVCIERDELEDHYKGMLDTKDLQLRKMADEYAELEGDVLKEKVAGEQALEAMEAKWKALQAQWVLQRAELMEQIQLRTEERDRAIRERDKEKGLARELAIPDPELDVLRAQIVAKDAQIAELQKGVQLIVVENETLQKDLDVAKIREETAQADWEPQIRWRDERYEAMVKEHEAVKEILTLEMRRAQESCKAIEEQVRKFPNPFEEELREAEAKYAQSQAGMMKLSQANVQLREELLDQKELAAKEVAQMEEQLAMAAHILREIATLGDLRNMMSKEAVKRLEAAFGMDFDGEEKEKTRARPSVKASR